MLASVQPPWTPHSCHNLSGPAGFGSQNPTDCNYYNENTQSSGFEEFAGSNGYCNNQYRMHPANQPAPPTFNQNSQNWYHANQNNSLPPPYQATPQPQVWNHPRAEVNISAQFVPIHQNAPVSMRQSFSTPITANQVHIAPETVVSTDQVQNGSCSLQATVNKELAPMKKKIPAKQQMNTIPIENKAIEKPTAPKSNRGRKKSPGDPVVKLVKRRETNRIAQEKSRAAKKKLTEDLQAANEILQKADMEKNWALHEREVALQQMNYTLQEREREIHEKDEQIQYLLNELNKAQHQLNAKHKEEESLTNEYEALKQQFNMYENGYEHQ